MLISYRGFLERYPLLHLAHLPTLPKDGDTGGRRSTPSPTASPYDGGRLGDVFGAFAVSETPNGYGGVKGFL